MQNPFWGLEITIPLKPTFLKISEFQQILTYLQKVRFKGAKGGVMAKKNICHGLNTVYEVLYYMGEDGFYLLWGQKLP